MQVINITDIESLILLKVKIEESENKKFTLDDFIKTYVANISNIYSFLCGETQDIKNVSLFKYKNETYVFNVNDLPEEEINKFVDILDNKPLKEIKMENIDLTKNYIINDSKYFEIIDN